MASRPETLIDEGVELIGVRHDYTPVLAQRLDRVPTVHTQLTTCQGILGTVATSIEC